MSFSLRYSFVETVWELSEVFEINHPLRSICAKMFFFANKKRKVLWALENALQIPNQNLSVKVWSTYALYISPNPNHPPKPWTLAFIRCSLSRTKKKHLLCFLQTKLAEKCEHVNFENVQNICPDKAEKSYEGKVMGIEHIQS